MKLRFITNQLLKHLPLVAVIAVAVIIAVQNIDLNTHYSGWDNIHAEFDILRYSRQVLFGAWIEHQGMGAPAAQGHLAEVARLPILWLLTICLPDNLVRISYIFGLYLIGGIGMYFYLSQIWLRQKTTTVRTWLAALGAILYLLHVLTLQQFYISFEMFMAQFAFLPFVLLTIHRLSRNLSVRSCLIFIGMQFLIAPSGHTPTVFYLGALFSLLYAFFINFNKGIFKAISLSFLIGVLTLSSNAFWILPNLYYSTHNAHYVQESRENQLFGPESVWSIREASTFPNLLKGTHYLFNWKDYSFKNQQFDYIFNEWQAHLNYPLVSGLLMAIGIVTIAGILFVIIDRQKGFVRWPILITYVGCLLFIWLELFPTKIMFDYLYTSGSFLEAFRNPFTKLSIIYSFVSVLLFVQTFEGLIQLARRIKLPVFIVNTTALLLILGSTLAIIYTAWPSFQGHFISEKLQIVYPEKYRQMFDYLKTRDRELRVLQLPQFSHAGWEYYDWQFLGEDNGYQGMGFYFFGIPQAVLHRDSDRWVETSDFAYHEIKYALDGQDSEALARILAKYRIDLIIVDETRVDPHRIENYEQDHQLATASGMTKVWEQDFLTIYERESPDEEEVTWAPTKVTPVNAQTDRVRLDPVYQNLGDYIPLTANEAQIFYPFAHLTATEVDNLTLTTDGWTLTQPVPSGVYNLQYPGQSGSTYLTPALVKYQDKTVQIVFPAQKILLENETVNLPHLENIRFEVEDESSAIIIFLGDNAVVLNQGTTVTPVLSFEHTSFEVNYTPKPETLPLTPQGAINLSALTVTPVVKIDPDWDLLTGTLSKTTSEIDAITFATEFQTSFVNLTQNPSLNCETPLRGSFSTEVQNGGVLYRADGFGVNCNGYDFEYISPSYSYIMNFVGRNIQGRGTKVFVNYSESHVLPEDYLLQDSVFNTSITLPQVSSDNTSIFHLNWETRSLGKESINELSSIQITPVPLTQIAQLKLEGDPANSPIFNSATINSSQAWFDSIYVVDVTCDQRCFIGLDQSFDDSWLGIKVGSGDFLPHYRLNNWGNGWEINQSGKVVLFYLPEVVSLTSLGILVISLSVLSIWTFKRTNKTSRLKLRTKRRLSGIKTR